MQPIRLYSTSFSHSKLLLPLQVQNIQLSSSAVSGVSAPSKYFFKVLLGQLLLDEALLLSNQNPV